VSDGTLFIAATRALPSATPDELERWVATDAEGYLAMGISSLVFRSHGKMIPGGYRHGHAGDGGQGMRRIRVPAAEPGWSWGCGRSQIDVVINSHAHVDHVGWNTHDHDDHTHLTFPNATYYMLDEEFEHYTKPEQIAASPTLQQTVVPLRDSGHLELAKDGRW